MRRLYSAVVLFSAVAVSAQVTAHQGSPDSSVKQFKSPMVLDLPAPGAEPQRWGKGEVRTDDKLDSFICENVSFHDFAIESTYGGDSSVNVAFIFELRAAPGIDKRADVSIDLMSEGEVVGTTTVKNIKVEERKKARRRTAIDVPDAKLMKKPTPTVRITLSVRDDP